MNPELQKPKITVIKVRMDCNGCVQKIKKALYGVNGIYDLYIDFPQQKLTVIGWAEPEKIMKAIKKTRKIATICSHTETEPDPPLPPEQPPAAEGPNPPSTETPPPQQENPPPEEPPKENASLPENSTPPPTEKLSETGQPAQPTGSSQPAPTSGSEDAGGVHVIHHHPPEYGYRYDYGYNYGGHWNKYQNRGFVHEPPVAIPPPGYVTHSYNTYKPPPYVTEYVRAPPYAGESEYVRAPPKQRLSPYADEHQYVRAPMNQRWLPYAGEYEYGRPPPPQPTNYSTRMDRYSEFYHNGSSSNNGNITSIFSDENPNACSVM